MPSGSPNPSPRWHLWYLLSAPFAWNAASCSLSAKCPAFLSGAVSRNHTDDMGCKGEAGNCLLSLDRGLAHTRICWDLVLLWRGVTGEKSNLDPSPGSLRNQKDLVTTRFPSVRWPHSKDPRNRDKQDFDSPYTPKSVHTGV